MARTGSRRRIGVGRIASTTAVGCPLLCLFAGCACSPDCAVRRPELPHQARRCPSLRSWLLRRHTRSCTLQPCPTLAPHNLNPWPRPVCRSRGEGSCEARNLSLAHNFSMENATQRGVFGKIFLRLAPGGARGDSFVRCHVKVIRLFRNFTPRRRRHGA